MKYGIMMLDLDGTIIGRDNKISPRVFAAVTKAAEKVQVSIATGRETDEVLRYARQLGLRTPQVSDNGASIVDPDTGVHLWRSGLSPAHAEEIVTRLTSMGVPFMATSPLGTIKSIVDVTHWELTRVSALDISETAADAVLQAFGGLEVLHMVKVYLPYNDLWAVDFTRVGITKGAAAAKLGELLGYGVQGTGYGEKQSGLIAAGDSYNDIQMLRAADLRIVMGGAPAEVKALADYIAPPVEEDGLAVAIEEFVLPRL